MIKLFRTSFLSKALCCIFLSSFAVPTSAFANVVYDLDSIIGATGTITTDGTIGVLQTANIVDFNITLQLVSTTTITGPLSGANYSQYGTDTANNSLAFTATATGLFFDFSATANTPYLIFQGNGGQLCFNGFPGNCSGDPHSIQVAIGADESITQASGNIQIATVAASAVPEPSTWAMMILGFAGVGFMAYRRRNQFVTA
jgi:hypothetical protein